MQITLKQDELEVAVRDYVVKMGITRPVGNISFTSTRGADGGIVTDIDLDEPKEAVVTNIDEAMKTESPTPVATEKEEEAVDAGEPETGETKSLFK